MKTKGVRMLESFAGFIIFLGLVILASLATTGMGYVVFNGILEYDFSTKAIYWVSFVLTFPVIWAMVLEDKKEGTNNEKKKL
ncbi:hypothetical protein TSARBOMBA_183 [Bacillus phage TsarBomba]|uniref:Uncharacterized protein n=1 Tax=Bacillus phage TsarBomba TaxID=1690456 RepID=A0A0K2D0T8_9CAUD|nr:hypothetical protein TSARBOMBA_183 [Bacillus phage TsarBomba]ALA13216.1 hypothetical protein TSARBOMBA_183 [Bacillus phage TsarBomba]